MKKHYFYLLFFCFSTIHTANFSGALPISPTRNSPAKREATPCNLSLLAEGTTGCAKRKLLDDGFEETAPAKDRKQSEDSLSCQDFQKNSKEESLECEEAAILPSEDEEDENLKQKRHRTITVDADFAQRVSLCIIKGSHLPLPRQQLPSGDSRALIRRIQNPTSLENIITGKTRLHEISANPSIDHPYPRLLSRENEILKNTFLDAWAASTGSLRDNPLTLIDPYSEALQAVHDGKGDAYFYAKIKKLFSEGQPHPTPDDIFIPFTRVCGRRSNIPLQAYATLTCTGEYKKIADFLVQKSSPEGKKFTETIVAIETIDREHLQMAALEAEAIYLLGGVRVKTDRRFLEEYKKNQEISQ